MRPPLPDARAIAAAVQWLRNGGVIAFPTETVYGLGAAISNESAAQRIFDLKRRPRSRPLMAHVSGVEMAKSLVQNWTPRADELARRFWPGPLTLVLPKAAHVSDVVTGDGPTIGVRCPDHPAALALIEALGEAIAGTSANRSGEPALITPEEVRREFESDLVHVFDAGPALGARESTVLLLGNNQTEDRVIRPGPIGPKDLV